MYADTQTDYAIFVVRKNTQLPNHMHLHTVSCSKTGVPTGPSSFFFFSFVIVTYPQPGKLQKQSVAFANAAVSRPPVRLGVR